MYILTVLSGNGGGGSRRWWLTAVAAHGGESERHWRRCRSCGEERGLSTRLKPRSRRSLHAAGPDTRNRTPNPDSWALSGRTTVRVPMAILFGFVFGLGSGSGSGSGFGFRLGCGCGYGCPPWLYDLWAKANFFPPVRAPRPGRPGTRRSVGTVPFRNGERSWTALKHPRPVPGRMIKHPRPVPGKVGRRAGRRCRGGAGRGLSGRARPGGGTAPAAPSPRRRHANRCAAFSVATEPAQRRRGV